MKPAAYKKPGKGEARLSMAIMAILVIVGAGVIIRQFQINPGVVALRPESHLSGLPQESDRSTLINTVGSGIVPFSPREQFSPDTLYEKINGRADLYLSAGFISLVTQRFTTDKHAGNWVEAFVYDMATPANAFSVFSMQRREGARSDDVAPKAYRTKNALFMTHDKFYVEMIGTDTSTDLQETMRALAQGFIDAHGGTTMARAPGADLFPAENIVPDSLQLIASNAFGYEQLDRIYTCVYNIDGSRLTAFVSERQSKDAAAAMAEVYAQTLLSYGASVVDGPVSVNGATFLQFFDTYEIVFSQGRYLAGIHEADSLETAGGLAQRLSDHLNRENGK